MLYLPAFVRRGRSRRAQTTTLAKASAEPPES